jgi:RNA polymerase sigma-70 factor, ECF subfamily
MQTTCDVPKFWLEYKDMVYSYILKHTKDNDLAQDLTQEVLLKVYRFCLSRSGVKNERSWLFEIARNTIMDHYRKHKQTVSCEALEESDESPATVDVYKSMADYIEPLLTCLPDMYRQPLQLDLEGVDQKEIARRLGLELPTAKSRVQRARKLMKEQLFECLYLDLDADGKVTGFASKPGCKTLEIFEQKIKA